MNEGNVYRWVRADGSTYSVGLVLDVRKRLDGDIVSFLVLDAVADAVVIGTVREYPMEVLSLDQAEKVL